MTDTKPPRVLDRTTLIWLALMLATIISWVIGHETAIGSNLAAGAVLLIAFAKVRYVGLDFMELREAPTVLRLLFELWTALTCAVLIGMAMT